MKSGDLAAHEADIVKAYRDGRSLRQIAREYGCQHRCILDCLERNGVPRRPRGCSAGPQAAWADPVKRAARIEAMKAAHARRARRLAKVKAWTS